MRTLKTLLASGAAIAALSTGTAFANGCTTAQPTCPVGGASIIENRQSQHANTTAASEVSGTNVKSAAGIASASGNLVAAGAANTTVRVANDQYNRGSAHATSTVSISKGAGEIVNGAAATGNGMTVETTQSTGYVDSLQVSGWGVAIGADARTVARNVGVSVTTAQAAANNANVTPTGGAVKTDLLQYNASTVSANAKAELCCADQASVGAIAAGNTATTLGLRTRLQQSVRQDNTGAVRATSDLVVGRSGDVQSSAAASGNANTAGTALAGAVVNANQTNSGAVQANAWLAGSWNGYGAASAYGVGNANDAVNSGGDLTTNATQVNTGTVRAWAAINGGGVGADSATVGAAVAIGNSNSATLCTDCGQGALRVSNTQTNSGGVEAISRVTTRGVGSVSSSASATGNAASFYVGTSKH